MRGVQNVINLTGQTFGKLTVLHRERVKDTRHRHACWRCRCECGNEVVVQGRLLRGGYVISCGCISKEKRAREKIFPPVSSASLDRLDCETGDPYQNLASAIVAVAADDYRTALKEGNKGMQGRLEKFFASSWCALLTNVDCVLLCQALQKEYLGELKGVYI